MERTLFGLSSQDFRRIACDLLEHWWLTIHSREKKMAGKDRFYGVFKCKLHLSVRTPQTTCLSRAVRFNRPHVGFPQFSEKVSHVGYSHVWNIIQNLQWSNLKGQSKLTRAEIQFSSTVICATSTSGQLITFIHSTSVTHSPGQGCVGNGITSYKVQGKNIYAPIWGKLVFPVWDFRSRHDARPSHDIGRFQSFLEVERDMQPHREHANLLQNRIKSWTLELKIINLPCYSSAPVNFPQCLLSLDRWWTTSCWLVTLIGI